jgi:tripeptidyl-peptidase-1
MFEMELKKLSLKGLTFLVSSGDYGAVSPIVNIGGTSKCGYYVEYPASSPLMTSIGATQGPEVSQEEIACSVRNGAAITSGGGFSNVAQTPDYQKNAVENYFKVANPQPKPGFNRSGRGVPDLSLLGVNYQVVLFGSNESISGKSASTPVFAGMVTLINDCRLQKGKGPIGFLNQILYSLDSSYFVDITKGDNQCGEDLSLCCNEGFFASPGWDPVTGLGSPKFKLLKDKLCNL